MVEEILFLNELILIILVIILLFSIIFVYKEFTLGKIIIALVFLDIIVLFLFQLFFLTLIISIILLIAIIVYLYLYFKPKIDLEIDLNFQKLKEKLLKFLVIAIIIIVIILLIFHVIEVWLVQDSLENSTLYGIINTFLFGAYLTALGIILGTSKISRKIIILIIAILVFASGFGYFSIEITFNIPIFVEGGNVYSTSGIKTARFFLLNTLLWEIIYTLSFLTEGDYIA